MRVKREKKERREERRARGEEKRGRKKGSAACNSREKKGTLPM